MRKKPNEHHHHQANFKSSQRPIHHGSFPIFGRTNSPSHHPNIIGVRTKLPINRAHPAGTVTHRAEFGVDYPAGSRDFGVRFRVTAKRLLCKRHSIRFFSGDCGLWHLDGTDGFFSAEKNTPYPEEDS